MQKTGIILVVIGFAVFLSMPFLVRHSINKELITQELGAGEKAEIASKVLSPVYETPLTSWELISKLKEVISSVNKEVTNRYALADPEISQLVGLAKKQNLDEAHVKVLLGNSTFKTEAFTSDGNWLFGRDFSSDEEAQNTIKQVANDITSYEIIPK